MFFNISEKFNRLTPGIPFRRFAHKVLLKGENCGYIEAANKRKYIFTPVLEKLDRKMEVNNFEQHHPRLISFSEFKILKTLFKPIIQNEKGFAKLNLDRKNLYFSPSPFATVIWDKDACEPVVTIVKKIKKPLHEIILHRFPLLRKVLRSDPFKNFN